jgi:CRISPR-associated protein Cas2
MAMAVVVTRDVADRYRGFMASVMAEVAPGVYVAPELSKAVRQRIWTVLSEWWATLPGGSVVMVWRDPGTPGGMGLSTLGVPPVTLTDLDGLLVVCRPLPPASAEAPPF